MVTGIMATSMTMARSPVKLRFTLLLLGSAFSLSASGQFFAQGPATVAVPLKPSSVEQLKSLLTAVRPQVTLESDDEISVQILGLDRYLPRQRVAVDGTVDLPLIGRVQVAGLTVQQLQAVIASRLHDGGFVRNPQVTVVAESVPSEIVTVTGAVNKPGIFPAYGRLTVTDYLSAAGGIVALIPNGTAAVNSPGSSLITLIRQGLPAPVVIPLLSDGVGSDYGDIPVFPGDVLRVGNVGTVYAFGALKAQGAYPLNNSAPTTVMELVSLAGGAGYEADLGSARIVRTIGSSKTVLAVDVKKILQGKAGDVALDNQDVLLIPTNQMKAAIKGGGTGLIISLASAYLYAVH